MIGTRARWAALFVGVALVALVALVVGCGASGASGAGTATANGDHESRGVDTTLRTDGVVYATGRLGRLMHLGTWLFAMLDVDESAELAQRLALDPERASALAVDPPSDAQRALVRRLVAATPASRDTPTPGAAQALERALSADADEPLHARVVVASSRPAATFDALAAFLTAQRFRKWAAAPAGIDAVFAKRRLVIALLSDETNVVIEILDLGRTGEGAEPSAAAIERARAELVRIRAGGRRSTAPAAPALAPDGLGRIVVVPELAAELQYLIGMSSVADALRQAEASVSDALFAAGSHEARAALELARDERGVFAERIELEARGTVETAEGTMRVQLGSALRGVITSGPASEGASISPIAFGTVEASRAVLGNVPMPRRAGQPESFDTLLRMLTEAGGMAPYLYSLPTLAIGAVRELLMDPTAPAIPAPIAATASRVGAAFGDHGAVRWALLPAGRGVLEAELELLRAAGLPRPRMVNAGQAVPLGPNVTAMTVGVGDRRAVLVSDEPEQLRASRLTATPPTTSIASGTISFTAFSVMFGGRLPLPPSYRVTMDVTPNEWVFHGAPGPAVP